MEPATLNLNYNSDALPKQCSITLLLSLLTHKKEHEPFLTECLSQEITTQNYKDFSILASRLIYGYAKLEKNPTQAKALLEKLLQFKPTDRLVSTLLEIANTDLAC